MIMNIVNRFVTISAVLALAGYANGSDEAIGATETEGKVEKIKVTSETEQREKADFPETEIFLFDLNVANEGNALSNGRNVTNRRGYDNQPYYRTAGRFCIPAVMIIKPMPMNILSRLENTNG